MTRLEIRSCTLALAITLAGALSAPAQLQGGDYVVAKYGRPPTVWRVTQGGTITTLVAGWPLSPYINGMGVTYTSTRALEVIIADSGVGRVYRISAQNQITTVVRNLASVFGLAIDRNGDYVVTRRGNTTGQSALLRVTPVGVVSTIAILGTGGWGVTVNAAGDYLVATGDTRTPAVLRVTPGGTIHTIHQGAPLRQPENVVVLGDGDLAVYDGVSPPSVFRIPRGGGAVSTIYVSPAPLSSHDMSPDFFGGMVLGESDSITNARVLQLAVDGTSRTIAQGFPLTNLGDVVRAPHLIGPRHGTPGQSHFLPLHFPGEGGSAYVMFASLSQFPGIGLPGPDPRRTPLNPDAVFVRSFGANDMMFVRWSGRLSAIGRATPTLNVPPTQLYPGLTVFVQAVTLDPSAPNGVRSFANVHTIVF